MTILPQDSCKSYFFASFKPKKSASLISFDAHQLFSSYIKKSFTSSNISVSRSIVKQKRQPTFLDKLPMHLFLFLFCTVFVFLMEERHMNFFCFLSLGLCHFNMKLLRLVALIFFVLFGIFFL